MKPRRRMLTFASGSAALAVLAAACTIVNGLEVPKDAGAVDGADTGADAEVDLCQHAYLAPPKDAGTPGDASLRLTVVAREVNFANPTITEDAGGQTTAGFDLDRRCSCPAAESCLPAKERNGAPACDDDAGRDNAIREFVQFIKSGYNFDFDKNAKESVERGQAALLFSVLDYNGEADDPLVRVGALISPGLFAELPDGGSTDTYITPTYSANDRWATTTGEAVYLGPIQGVAPLKVVDGYVRDYTLYVPSVEVKLRLRAGMTMKIDEAVVVAPLVKLGEGVFTIERGTVAGRWQADDAYRMFGGVERNFPDSGLFLCKEAAVMNIVRQFVCEAVDLAAGSRLDNTGAPCSAGSVVFTFSSVPASLGNPRDIPPYDPCGFGGDAGISCAP